MKKYIILITWSLLFSASSFSQCVESNQAFRVGEEMKYYAYYNLGAIWVKAGEGSFSVGEEDGNYVFTVKANNLPVLNRLYRLQTNHQATMTKDLKPVSLTASVVENKNWSDEKYTYKEGRIHRHIKSNVYPEGKDTVYVHTPCSWDIINAVYIARNKDLRSVPMGQQIPFYLNFNDSTHTVYGQVLKRERITNKEGQEFDCLKCTVTTAPGTIFSDDKLTYFWVTDCPRQIPVLVESHISIGSIKIFLYDYKEGEITKKTPALSQSQ